MTEWHLSVLRDHCIADYRISGFQGKLWDKIWCFITKFDISLQNFAFTDGNQFSNSNLVSNCFTWIKTCTYSSTIFEAKVKLSTYLIWSESNIWKYDLSCTKAILGWPLVNFFTYGQISGIFYYFANRNEKSIRRSCDFEHKYHISEWY